MFVNILKCQTLVSALNVHVFSFNEKSSERSNVARFLKPNSVNQHLVVDTKHLLRFDAF